MFGVVKGRLTLFDRTRNVGLTVAATQIQLRFEWSVCCVVEVGHKAGDTILKKSCQAGKSSISAGETPTCHEANRRGL